MQPAPPTEEAASDPVTLINSFEVPPGRDGAFLALWGEINTYMKTKPGCLSHRLHRALSPEAPFRFINVATWRSRADFEAAHDAGFRGLISQPGWSEFASKPVLFSVAVEHSIDRA